MKILWMNWKDRKNPYAGGAELVNEQLAKRLVCDGHEVVFLVRGFDNAPKEEIVDGYKIIRLGNFHTVYWEAYKYYKKNLQGWADLVIEEINTIPFFCNWYVHPVKSSKAGAEQFNRGKERGVLYFNQLCREIWFYEMGLVKGLIGYIAEAVYLLLLGNRDVITISESSKRDLQRFGFKRDKIKIIGMGLEIEPLKELESCEIIKYPVPTMLSLGSLRPMKRTDQIILAFELAKKDIPDLQLIVAGDLAGNIKALQMMQTSPYKNSIQFLGRVSKEKKTELMQKSHLIAVTSVKEGWGLIVTEANSQGTPAVVYNIDGLRDSVKNNETGIIATKNTPQGLAEATISLLSDREKYAKMRINAWQWSKQLTFDESYKQFINILDIH